MSAIPHFKPNVAGVNIDHVNSVCSQALEDFFGGCPIFTEHLFLVLFPLSPCLGGELGLVAVKIGSGKVQNILLSGRGHLDGWDLVEANTQFIAVEVYAISGEVKFRSTNQFIIHGRSNFSSRSFFRRNYGVGHCGEESNDQSNGGGFRHRRSPGDCVGSGNNGLACERRWPQTPVERAFASGRRDWCRASRDHERRPRVAQMFQGAGVGFEDLNSRLHPSPRWRRELPSQISQSHIKLASNE